MPSADSDTAIRAHEQISPRPGLLDEVRRRLRLKRYSLRTEQACLHWIRRYIRCNGLRHLRELGGAEVERFLSDLATRARVAPSTQNQALAALLFLYREVLALELPWMEGIVRAKRAPRLPSGAVPGTNGGAVACNARKGSIDGRVAVRQRLAVDGVPAPGGQGCRFRLQRNRGARRQRREGPQDRTASCLAGRSARTDRTGPCDARARPGDRFRRGVASGRVGAQAPTCRACVLLAVRVSSIPAGDRSGRWPRETPSSG